MGVAVDDVPNLRHGDVVVRAEVYRRLLAGQITWRQMLAEADVYQEAHRG